MSSRNIEPFSNQSIKSTIVTNDGSYTNNIDTTDIEMVLNHNKSGKICLSDQQTCLTKNNIISIFTARDINDSMNAVYDSLIKDINDIEYWNKGTTDQDSLNKYLQDNYYDKDNVYLSAEVNNRYYTLPENYSSPFMTLSEGNELYLQKATPEDPYLTVINANKRYYPIDAVHGDPYLTKREAKQLLEPIPKENESPFVTLTTLSGTSGFTKYMTDIQTTVKTINSNNDIEWQEKINEDRQLRQTTLKQVNDKRDTVLLSIRNTKQIFNYTQANEYLTIIRHYMIQATMLVNKIKNKLVHTELDDINMDNVYQYNQNIQNNYEEAEKTFDKMREIYFNVFNYIREVYLATTVTAITAVETKYNKDKSDYIEATNLLNRLKLNTQLDYTRIINDYNKLYQSSIIDNKPPSSGDIEKGIDYINELYIGCNTYLFDMYYSDLGKYLKEASNIYIKVSQQADTVLIDPKIRPYIPYIETIYNTIQEYYNKNKKDKELAYVEKQTIYNQLQLCKNTKNAIEVSDYTTNAQAAYARYQTLQTEVYQYYSECKSMMQFIRTISEYIPLRKKRILFNAYNVGFSKGYDLPYLEYSYMTFDPSTTVTWNFNNPSIKKQLVGLRCSAYPPNKEGVNIELLNPNGSNYKKGMFGRDNAFFIRIMQGENVGKICKLDMQQNILVAAVDPGYFRDYTYYFYFEESHTPRWYYLRTLYKDLAMIHNHSFIRPTKSIPKQTKNDDFLWMII